MTQENPAWNLPKSVNFFRGRCPNSAYSLPSSIRWSCSTSGRRVTIPVFYTVNQIRYYWTCISQNRTITRKCHCIWWYSYIYKCTNYQIHGAKSLFQQCSPVQRTCQNSRNHKHHDHLPHLMINYSKEKGAILLHGNRCIVWVILIILLENWRLNTTYILSYQPMPSFW